MILTCFRCSEPRRKSLDPATHSDTAKSGVKGKAYASCAKLHPVAQSQEREAMHLSLSYEPLTDSPTLPNLH